MRKQIILLLLVLILLWESPLVYSMSMRPDNPDKAYSRALSFFINGLLARNFGQPDKAYRFFDKSLNSSENKYFEQYLYLGITSLEIDLPEKAAVFFDEARLISPRDPRADFILAFQSFSNGNRRESKEILERILEVDPEHFPSMTLLSQIYIREGNFKDSLYLLSRLMDVDKLDAAGEYSLGVLYYKNGRVKESIRVFESILERSPRNFEARLALAMIYVVNKYFDEAISEFKYLYSMNQNDVRVLGSLADIYRTKRDFASSAEYLEKSLLIEPMNLRAYIKLALNYMELQKHENAVMVLKRAQALAPEKQELSFYLARAYEADRRFENAIFYYKQAQSFFYDMSSYYYRLARLYDLLNEKETACYYMKMVIEHAPDNHAAYNYLAYTYLEMGRSAEDALSYAEKIVLLAPEVPEYMDTLGWVYYHLNRLDDAKYWTEKAFSLKPNDVIIGEHLSDILWRKGEKKESVTVLERVSNTSDEAESLQEKLQFRQQMIINP